VTQASLFGVGAPEAVLVGVVALVVFGPKGLAEAAKSLGKSLKGLQPTIRELAGVSTELKRTLEQEIGLDEIRNEWRGTSSPLSDDTFISDSSTSTKAALGDSPNGSDSTGTSTNSSGNTVNSSTDGTPPTAVEAAAQSAAGIPELRQVTDSLAKSLDPDIERKREESARAAWGHQRTAEVPSQQTKVVSSSPSLQGLSIEELEAELSKRKTNKQQA
jgi:TatA/E family protein of Tat protein translocase